jgi:hypothetical protein
MIPPAVVTAAASSWQPRAGSAANPRTGLAGFTRSHLLRGSASCRHGWARGIVATSQHSTQEITREISAEAAVHGSINHLLTFLDHVRPLILFKKI